MFLFPMELHGIPSRLMDQVSTKRKPSFCKVCYPFLNLHNVLVAFHIMSVFAICYLLS